MLTNILVSSAGRRIALLACFRDSMAARSAHGAILAIDSGVSAPATFACDEAWKVPLCTDRNFIDTVLDIAAEHKVGLLIPTIDTELPVYAAAASRFAKEGVSLCVSTPQVVRICGNKVATHQWLLKHRFPTVRQTELITALKDVSAWPLPLIVKPVDGSASFGVRIVNSPLELEALAGAPGSWIVQEIARGREFTINTYVNRQGRCICAVPHWRMEVRAGEVSKGITVKDEQLMRMAHAIAETLPGAYGPLSIQCFLDDTKTLKIIEINARFGGGYPLTHRAGARFTDWLLDEREGKCVSPRDDWAGDLAMLRYDDAIFIPGRQLRS
jgi:carbamoyl-phosphate synthase large subunit